MMSLLLLVEERRQAKSVCDAWEARGEWENVPEAAVQRSIDADRALLRWFDNRETETVSHIVGGLLGDPDE